MIFLYLELSTYYYKLIVLTYCTKVLKMAALYIDRLFIIHSGLVPVTNNRLIIYVVIPSNKSKQTSHYKMGRKIPNARSLQKNGFYFALAAGTFSDRSVVSDGS